MSRRTPWSPIFDVERSTGDIVVGSTPPTAVPPTLSLLTSVSDGDTGIISPQDTALSGSYAYFVDDLGDSINVVDVSTPASASLTGQLQTFTSAGSLNSVYRVAYLSGHCYAIAFTSSTYTLRAIDVSTPASPSIVGSKTDATIDGLHVSIASGSHLFMLRQFVDSITAVDVSTPATMTIAGTLTDVTNLNGVFRGDVSGSHLFVTTVDTAGVTSVDISTPASPTVSDSITDGSVLQYPADLFVSGSHAFVLDYTSGSLVAIDITTPGALSIAGSITDAALADAWRIAVAGGVAYVVTIGATAALAAVDVSDPTTMTIIDTIEVDGVTLDGLRDVSAVSGAAFVSATGTDGALAVYGLA